jgi:chromosome segregation ATPase
LRIIKHFWQNLVQRFKPRASASAGEFQHDLSVARQEQQNLLGQFNDLRADIEQERSAAGQEKQVLRGALAGLQSEVEQGLSVTREEQQRLLGQMTSLQAEFERELSAARLEKQTLLGQVSGLQDDLERLRSRDEQLRAELQQRFDQVQAERDTANQEVMALRSSLADSASRQERIDTCVNSLELRLREQQQEYDAALQQALVRERRQARRLNAVMAVAAAAFVLGIVGGAISFLEVRNTTHLLAGVSRGIREIQTSMEGYTTGNTPATPTSVTPASSEGRVSPGAPESRPAGAEATPQEQGVVE